MTNLNSVDSDRAATAEEGGCEREYFVYILAQHPYTICVFPGCLLHTLVRGLLITMYYVKILTCKLQQLDLKVGLCSQTRVIYYESWS